MTKLSKIKSPLRYPGGKNRAIKTIAPLIPEFREYREPFLGGGSVFFHVKQQYQGKKYWINDLYKELYHFWSLSQINLNEVVNQVQIWKSEYEDGQALFLFLKENLSEFSDLETASAFFVLNRITFSGTSESGGFSKQAFQKRFTESSIERLKLIDNVLSEAKITNLDYQEVVEAEGEEVFIFLDPPYYSATKSSLYGKKGNLHKGFDHERFAEVMKRTNHKWLITYDNSDYVRELFSFANIFTWELTYGMRNVKGNIQQKEKEIFISNYLQPTESNDPQLMLF
ncbi:MAG: DNA adenine methylase [Saprospiraceae bacterium]|nr:DNA adenine methylase [Saprospiraceae bacterium]